MIDTTVDTDTVLQYGIHSEWTDVDATVSTSRIKE